MIELVDLGKSFFDKKLFQNVNLKFNKGHTYGIIGANGVGKSTLLKIIAKEIESSAGEIVVEKEKRISVLDQNQNIYDDFLVTEVVIMGNKELYDIKTKKDAIYNDPNSNEKDFEKAAHLEELFGAKGGWNAENDAQILLDGLGISNQKFNHLMKHLKSSEKVKILLAKALFGNPDLLILDEPTNHLDLRAIRWLENFLVEYQNLVLVVSHDSDFLDQVCTNIVDIDFGKAKMYTGNYTFWKESSELALDLIKKKNTKKEEQIKKLQEFIAKFSANASKSSQATSRKKSLEKISLSEIVPSNRKYPFIKFELNHKPGKNVLRVEDLSYVTSRGETLFEKVSFSIYNNEKIALIGEDDIAKLKFLEILFGIEKPTTGFVIWGSTIKLDYYPSNNDHFFDTDENILQWMSKWPLKNYESMNKDNSDSRIRSFLGRMFFSNNSVFKKAKDCSGGEKARLMYSKMMLTESNFLLFNQPLEHLDSESIYSINKAIKDYKSACIFVTYNRGLIKNANVIFELKKDSSFIFRGSLEEYEKHMEY